MAPQAHATAKFSGSNNLTKHQFVGWVGRLSETHR